MYHLIFHSKKHQPSTYYYRQPKINRGSTHNQFELDTIRGSIKSRWELHGFGTQSFQQAIWLMEERLDIKPPPMHLHKNMNGHIITVENAADAIWFRLNHENVSKNKCSLIEIYKDLDTDFINSQYSKFAVQHKELTDRTNLHSTLNNSNWQLERFVKNSYIEMTTTLIDDAKRLLGNSQRLIADHEAIIENARKQCRDIAQTVFDHIAEKRTSIS